MKNKHHYKLEYLTHKEHQQDVQNQYEDACQQGNLELVQETLLQGANAYAMNGYGFRIACQHGYVEIVEHILDKVFHEKSDTSSHLIALGLSQAALEDHLSVLKAILKHSPGFMSEEVLAMAPPVLITACDMKSTQVINYLFENFLCQENMAQIQNFLDKKESFFQEEGRQYTKELLKTHILYKNLEDGLEQKKSSPRGVKI